MVVTWAPVFPLR